MNALVKSARAIAKVAKEKVGAWASVATNPGTGKKPAVEYVIVPPRPPPAKSWEGFPEVLEEPPRKEFKGFQTSEGFKRVKVESTDWRNSECRTSPWEKMFF